ncbi:hypothetical protein [Streptomyces sp. N35]|uniref:hypothetical protein n=1 Tax=Streptomyces sp. N35 TaxID=2795730 RepID=UPI0018F463E3|nr:hypothetical protein [Streptomyces sp. N35]
MKTHTIRMAAAAGISALALFSAACSTDSGKDDKTDSSQSAADKEAKKLDCLREKGVKVTQPKSNADGQGIDSGNLDKEEMEQAMKDCGMDMTGAGGGGEMSQADKDKALAFAKCMREAGLDFKDPDFKDGSQSAQQIPEGEELEKYTAASDKCSKKAGY